MSAPARNVMLLASFEDERHERIMRDCASVIGKDIGQLWYVTQLGRVGYTGARLFKCHVKNGRVFVVKVDTQNSIEEEAAAIAGINPYYDAGLLNPQPVVCDDLAALLYKYMGGTNVARAAQVKEFHEIAFDIVAIDDASVGQLMKNVYSQLQHSGSGGIEQIAYVDEYHKYLRSHRSKDAMQSFLKQDFQQERFDFHKTNIVNPSHFVQDPRFRSPTNMRRGPVHGDLHPKNVMVDPAGNVYLIDFAWAKNIAHRLKDYVLMECSLRFMLFPPRVNLDEQLAVDQVLLSADGTQSVSDITKESTLADHYRRLATLVGEIRASALPVLVSSGPGVSTNTWLLSSSSSTGC